MNLSEPELTDIAKKVLAQRYLMRNEAGEVIETPREMFVRVAKHIAEAETKWGGDPEIIWPRFYEVMARGDFLPNTPCLVNAGRPQSQNQFSACFVLPVEDSMRAIFDTLSDMAQIHKSGGGTGFSFSRLRPKDDFVASTTGVASGPVSFMRAYDHVTEVVKQSGVRRGANMGILRVDHPDIREFILAKQDVRAITNFNISVAITDAFMKAYFESKQYPLVNPRTGAVVRYESAREIWALIVEAAHLTGDPGLFFIDRANRLDPMAHVPGYEIEAVNPCGEVPLCPYNACTLGSINLSNFLKGNSLDFDRLAGVIHLGVRFLDNVLELNRYPIGEIAEATATMRKIGLGVMGWAELLIKLGIDYESRQARELARQSMGFIYTVAIKSSMMLAKERGAFLAWDRSKWAQQMQAPRRNATTTVIAPTGSISIIAGCSGGIEPLFALCQTRKQADMVMVDFNPLFEEIARREGFWTEEVKEHVTVHGTLKGCSGVPERWKEVFKIANEIDPLCHVEMQAAFQQYTEDAVSKTINLPSSATKEDVEAAYLAAWDLGCKGITVYRDGSRPNQTLTAGTGVKDVTPAPERRMEAERRRIPTDGRRNGATFTEKTAYGSIHVTINEHPDGEPFELFITMGKAGSEVAAWCEALGRTASLMLATSYRPRQRLVELVEQLSGVGGGSRGMSSAADGVARCIDSYLGGEPQMTGSFDICPACQEASLIKSGGCDTCTRCGFARC